MPVQGATRAVPRSASPGDILRGKLFGEAGGESSRTNENIGNPKARCYHDLDRVGEKVRPLRRLGYFRVFELSERHQQRPRCSPPRTRTSWFIGYKDRGRILRTGNALHYGTTDILFRWQMTNAWDLEDDCDGWYAYYYILHTIFTLTSASSVAE